MNKTFLRSAIVVAVAALATLATAQMRDKEEELKPLPPLQKQFPLSQTWSQSCTATCRRASGTMNGTNCTLAAPGS